MAVKEIPINVRTYYKSMMAAYTQLKADAVLAKDELNTVIADLWKSIYANISVYETEFNINLLKYKEFEENKYIDGVFLKTAKGMFINRKNNYMLVSDLFDLFNLARKQKQIYDLENDIKFYNKILALNFKQYTEILRVFYTEVHKHMILKGEGYVFEDMIGWTCINRCHIVKSTTRIDYKATKENKKKLLEEGKRLYNAEEAAWCKQNGLPYDGVDYRVYLNNEYCYEVPLIGCKLPNGSKYKLVGADYRGREIRGKHNDELISMCNSKIENICELPLDLRTKLGLCNTVDKMLYLNFIRNENQQPINATEISRKNR